jgi:phosphatidylserine/phosphatidylglycerophosphate/cardiolipin synthase-like enzyme
MHLIVTGFGRRAARLAAIVTVVLCAAGGAPPAHALDTLCDSAFQNCRTQLIQLIDNEQVAIDVGMWFMEDARFSNALIRAKQRNVKIRILMDPRSNVQHPTQPTVLSSLQNAGIPMRKRIASGIEHWKIMVFDRQNVLYFGSANFSADAFVFNTPYVNYVDETIYYTDDPVLVNSFRTRFDDAWVNTSSYANYANVVAPLTRSYATFPVDPELNLPPGEDFIDRVVKNVNAEKVRIDAMMYRIADARATNSIIAAKNRNIPIRLIVDPSMYHDPTRFDVSFDFDRLYAAGVPLKVTVHQGINHGKLTLLHGLGMTIFGSSNWTTPSANKQHENNYFTKKAFIFDYFVNFFERRWNNTSPAGVAETGPFVPLPPDKPVNTSPAEGATGLGTSGVRLKWDAGFWGQYYDIMLGEDPNALPVIAADRFLGPSKTVGATLSFTLPTLKPGTTYFWKIRSKTAAGLFREGNAWSFKTAGTPPPLPPGTTTVVLWTAAMPDAGIQGDWARITDSTAAGNGAVQNPDRSRAKLAPALAAPADYFDISFTATANVPYHLWIRMKAQGNSVSNDSVHVQFSDSVDGAGTPIARIGSATSFEPVLQDGPGAPPPNGWGWTDNSWDAPGSHVYFAATGTHTIRIQQREDGPAIDQIVLSPDAYLLSPPGPHYGDTTILPQASGGGPPPPTCTDPKATNNGGPLPCTYPPPPSGPSIVLWPTTGDVPTIAGLWRIGPDSGAGGTSMWLPDAAAPEVATALASPANYFEMQFAAEKDVDYHVWIRMRAQKSSTLNDSLHVQFSDAVDASSAPYARIGTTQSASFILHAGPEAPAPSSWGWTDNGFGTLGPHVRFATSGTKTIRIQQREDGAIIDQIVISPSDYLFQSPGAERNDTTVLPKTTPAPAPAETCTDPAATNQGQPLPCTYPPPPPPPTTCTDPTATNQGQPLPCTYPAPPSGDASGTIVLWPTASALSAIAGQWQVGDDSGAGGSSIWNPDAGAAKIAPAQAQPANYFEMTFTAQANVDYHVWVRMRAQRNSVSNDSVHMQFTGTENDYARIGTASSAEFVLQAGPTAPAPAGWGWTDNGWGSPGAHVRFLTSGAHTLRVQQREDGAIIDQIVISRDTYLTARPGSTTNDTTVLAKTP